MMKCIGQLHRNRVVQASWTYWLHQKMRNWLVTLIAVLGGRSTVGWAASDDQIELPDIVSSEAKEQAPSQQEQELLKPLPRLVSKSQKYFCMHYSKEQIKLRVALQREQQR